MIAMAINPGGDRMFILSDQLYFRRIDVFSCGSWQQRTKKSLGWSIFPCLSRNYAHSIAHSDDDKATERWSLVRRATTGISPGVFIRKSLVVNRKGG